MPGKKEIGHVGKEQVYQKLFTYEDVLDLHMKKQHNIFLMHVPILNYYIMNFVQSYQFPALKDQP